jgi:uncharacterized damage-inducible protein DinB
MVSVMDEAQIDDHGRPMPPQESGETATLLGFLDYQRATFEWKCRGMSDAELRVALPPTSMTLGGMLKHLAYVEDYWFTQAVGGAPPTQPWRAEDFEADPDWDWHSAAIETGDHLRALWSERAERSRAVVSSKLANGEVEALSETHPAWDGQGRVSLRWVLVHMIEEYARHNGHADLIREAIDGQTGE